MRDPVVVDSGIYTGDRHTHTHEYTLLLLSPSAMSDSKTPRTAARLASLSFTISRSLLRLVSIESVMPSNSLALCCPLLPSIFPSIRVFSNESALCISWSKYWSFSFNISPSNEYSGLISFQFSLVQSLSRARLFVTP